jgi:peptidoglycan/xylan/chitin deacetylase (PgdA/CDA1 family)
MLVRELIQRRRVTVLLYHDIAPALADRHFRKLRQLYHPISLHEFVRAQRDANGAALPAKSLIVTFDDGNRSNAELKEVFKRHSIEPAIFVCSGVVGTGRRFWFADLPLADVEGLTALPDEERERALVSRGFREHAEHPEPMALSHAEIAHLADVADFQSHTISHPILPRCSEDKARREIEGSKADLERELGLDIYAFAYPNGDYSGRDVRMVAEAGYDCAFTLDPGFNSVSTDPMRLKRLWIGDEDGIDELVVKACGLWVFLRRLLDSKYRQSRQAAAEQWAEVGSGRRPAPVAERAG